MRAVFRGDLIYEGGAIWDLHSLHRGALLVEGRGHRLFFLVDSFTPTGIDHYCPRNRNFLGPGFGCKRCIELVRGLEPPQVDEAAIVVGPPRPGSSTNFSLSSRFVR